MFVRNNQHSKWVVAMYSPPIIWSSSRYDLIQSVGIDGFTDCSFPTGFYELFSDKEGEMYDAADLMLSNGSFRHNRLAGAFAPMTSVPLDYDLQSFCIFHYLKVVDQTLRENGEARFGVDDLFARPEPEQHGDVMSAMDEIIKSRGMVVACLKLVRSGDEKMTPFHFMQDVSLGGDQNKSLIQQVMRASCNSVRRGDDFLELDKDGNFELSHLKMFQHDVFDVSDFRGMRAMMGEIESFPIDDYRYGLSPVFDSQRAKGVQCAFMRRLRLVQSAQPFVSLFGDVNPDRYS